MGERVGETEREERARHRNRAREIKTEMEKSKNSGRKNPPINYTAWGCIIVVATTTIPKVFVSQHAPCI